MFDKKDKDDWRRPPVPLELIEIDDSMPETDEDYARLDKAIKQAQTEATVRLESIFKRTGYHGEEHE